MLDANAFDYLLDHGIDVQALRARAELYITNVQHAELLAVPVARRRRRLIDLLSRIDPTVRPAGFDPDAERSRDGKDRAIAATAARERCTVVTDDVRFRQALLEEGAAALGCAEAFAGLPSEQHLSTPQSPPSPRARPRHRRRSRVR